jgi:hypothetical protein
VFGTDVHSIVNGFLELAVFAGVGLYAGFVVIIYLTYGTQRRPRLDLRDPVQSAGGLAVWIGVRILAVAVLIVGRIFAALSEASAEVGEWFLSRRHRESH